MQQHPDKLCPETRERLDQLERTVKELVKKSQINSSLIEIEKQIQNISKLISQSNASDRIDHPVRKNYTDRRLLTGKIIKFNPSVEINLLEVQMNEYEATMEELEKRTLLEEAGLYKPIHLNFCKCLDIRTPKIFSPFFTPIKNVRNFKPNKSQRLE